MQCCAGARFPLKILVFSPRPVSVVRLAVPQVVQTTPVFAVYIKIHAAFCFWGGLFRRRLRCSLRDLRQNISGRSLFTCLLVITQCNRVLEKNA